MGDDFTETLAAAEQLCNPCDHDGAWLAIEELPPIDRVMPEVIDLRLRILTNLGKRARRVVDSTKSARVSSNEWID